MRQEERGEDMDRREFEKIKRAQKRAHQLFDPIGGTISDRVSHGAQMGAFSPDPITGAIVGDKLDEEVGGLLGGDEGFNPGRYDGKISTDEEDLEEDRNENTDKGFMRMQPNWWKQQVKDRWTENPSPLGVFGVGQRNADRIEDRNEIRYARRHNLGLDRAADRSARKAFFWSDWNPGKMFGR